MKIRYSQWTRDRQIAVNSLRFDPQNPRLEGVGKGEKSVIQALAELEDISDLLKRITKYGLAPIERLVVIYEEEKPIVIEGNRRLAVYKMLLDPEKAPRSLASAVKKARNELGPSEIPRKVGCDIPQDVAEAKVYAYMKHADDKHFRPWAKIQQAVVDCGIADEMERGEPVAVPLTDATIRDARAMVEFFRLAGILSRDGKSGIKAKTLRNFPYDAVKRTFLAKDIGPLIGLKATKSGLEVKGDASEFTEFFRVTLSKMAEGRATRVFNTTEQAAEWVAETGYKPKGKKTESLAKHIESLDAHEDEEDDSSTKGRLGRKKTTKVARRLAKVFRIQLKPEYQAPKLEDLLGEVEKLNVERQQNLSAVGLRCVLELAVDGALEERGLMTVYTASLKGGRDLLSTRIQWLRDKSGITFDRDCSRALNALMDSNMKVAALDSLNAWVHSKWAPATGGDVQRRAMELTPLLQLLLSKG
ncbi:hypothetical protein [Haloferula sargassicola]|uniref:ParB/Sulfiredoxin domain-containing protein n=1 Tax=Haloferula sargassicola TaxID=490096 RepID=A0ABP9UN38_9BACT